MARSIHPLEVSLEQFLLLRAVRYNQRLPSALVRASTGALALTDEMLRKGFLERSGYRLAVTTKGQAALRRYSNGRAPMIDIEKKWLLDWSQTNRQYRIGSSLADILAKRVSSGE